MNNGRFPDARWLVSAFKNACLGNFRGEFRGESMFRHVDEHSKNRTIIRFFEQIIRPLG